MGHPQLQRLQDHSRSDLGRPGHEHLHFYCIMKVSRNERSGTHTILLHKREKIYLPRRLSDHGEMRGLYPYILASSSFHKTRHHRNRRKAGQGGHDKEILHVVSRTRASLSCSSKNQPRGPGRSPHARTTVPHSSSGCCSPVFSTGPGRGHHRGALSSPAPHHTVLLGPPGPS